MVSAALMAVAVAVPAARQQANQAARGVDAARVAVDADDIGGVVTGPNGPEAGVWVIAETSDLPTKYRKIVVTDDAGRYLIPDLPKANFEVWVRGYGLVDSLHLPATPGRTLALTPVQAPNARAAAQYYPSDYWLSLIQIPPKDAFPMTFAPPGGGGFGQFGPEGGAPARGGPAGGRGTQGPRVIQNQEQFINSVKGCLACHQVGNKWTRELSPALGMFPSSIAAWERRLRSGQTGAGMLNSVVGMGGHDKGLGMYADWSDRIAAGEVPPSPPRPQGIERNVVITLWDVSTPTAFVHDVSATDKRNPTMNGYGPIYGVEFHHDSLMMLDPVKNTTELIKIPTRTEKASLRPFTAQTNDLPSPVWGDEIIFTDYVNPNNLTMDDRGRVWMSAQIRQTDNPAYCSDGSTYYSQLYPVKQGRRQLSMYDPESKTFEAVDTCTHAHHVKMGEGANRNIVYFNGLPTGSIGWVNMDVLEKTKDEKAAQGWCRGFFDVDGDGKIDPKIDKAVQMAGTYSVIPDPTDSTVVWGAVPGAPGRIVRLKTATCIAEAYEPPFQNAFTSQGRVQSTGHRHRSQRPRVDGARRQRSSGQLRPEEVQGADRPARNHWAALPRGLDAVPDAWPAHEGRDRRNQLRLSLLQLRRSVRHARPWSQRAHRERQRFRRAHCGRAANRQDGDPARALSSRLLHAWP